MAQGRPGGAASGEAMRSVTPSPPLEQPPNVGAGSGHSVPFPEHSAPKPPDRFHAAYLGFFLMGVGLLLPFNAFITAVDYFGELYPGHHIERLFTVLYLLPNVLSVAVTARVSRPSSSTPRILAGFTGFLVSVLMVPVLDAAGIGDAEQGTRGTLLLTLAGVLATGVCDGIGQGSLFGAAGSLTPRFVQATVAGTGAAGFLVCLLRIATKAAMPADVEGLRRSATVYFAVAAAVEAACLVIYACLLPQLPLVKYYRARRRLAYAIRHGQVVPPREEKAGALSAADRPGITAEQVAPRHEHGASQGAPAQPIAIAAPRRQRQGTIAGSIVDITGASPHGVGDRIASMMRPQDDSDLSDPLIDEEEGDVGRDVQMLDRRRASVDDGAWEDPWMSGRGARSGHGPDGSLHEARAEEERPVLAGQGAAVRSNGERARVHVPGDTWQRWVLECVVSVEQRKALRQRWRHAIAVLLVYWVTLSIFPGFLAEDLEPGSLGSWLPVVLITVFNAADLVGKMMPNFVGVWPKEPSLLLQASVVRVLFVPVFYLAGLFRSGPLELCALTALLGVTNGHISAVAMMLAPKGLRPDKAETVGTTIVIFLLSGLCLGAFSGWLWLL